MNEQQAIEQTLQGRHEELERLHREKAGLPTQEERDKEQFKTFVRQFERGCCGE